MRTPSPPGRLVTLKSLSGLLLDGILYSGRPKAKKIVVHVHGSFGNFYQNYFLRVMAKYYRAKGIDFLSFNLAAHDGLAEGYWVDERFEYVGASVTEFSSCLEDIGGAIAYVSNYSQIVLQGHSLGCDRVLHYCATTGAKYPFILLSPCDSHALQVRWTGGETVERQSARLRLAAPKSDDELDWMSLREYGVAQGEWTYPNPITRKALLSILDGPVMQLLRFDDPSPKLQLQQPGIAYIGGADALQTEEPHAMFTFLKDRLTSLTELFIPAGGHGLESCEALVARKLADWVKSLSLVDEEATP